MSEQDTNGAEPQLQTVEATEAPAKPQWNDSQQAAIRQLLQKESQMKQREAQLSEELKLAKMLRDDPKNALKLAGHDMSKLAQPPKASQDPTSDRLSQMEEQLRYFQQQEEQRRQQQHWSSLQSDIEQQLDKLDDFPVLKAGKELGLHQMAVDEIMDHYQKTGEVMDSREAVSNVEAWLAGMVERTAPSLGWTKNKAPDASPRTLTNQDSSLRTSGEGGPTNEDMLLYPEKYLFNIKE